MLKKIIILPLFVLCFLVISAKSQPTEVKIKSLVIKSSSAANPYSRLDIVTDLFTDSAGEPWGFYGLTRCLPCRSGETIIGGQSSSTGIRFSSALPNGRIRYYQLLNGFVSTEQAQIPYFAPKRRNLEFFTDAFIQGELIVYDQSPTGGNREMLYTANINMNGDAKITFSPLSVPFHDSQFGYVKTSIFSQAELTFVAPE